MIVQEKIFNNFKYKITVGFLAVLLWFFVKTEDNYRYSFNVSTEVVNLGTDRVITNQLPKKIKATFWGKGRTLFTVMLRNDVAYILDVGKIDGSVLLPLDKSNIKLMRTTEVEALNIVEPKEIKIDIEKLITKKVAISNKSKIETLPGYTVVGDTKLIPDSVEIMGPKSTIKLISEVSTQDKTFRKIKKDVDKKVRLVVPDIPHVSLNIEHVQVFADVQKLMEKPFRNIPVQVINPPPENNAIVIPSTLSLVLVGGTDVLLNVSRDEIKAYIDYEKVKLSKDKTHPAYMIIPKGIRSRDVSPTHFKIVVVKKN